MIPLLVLWPVVLLPASISGERTVAISYFDNNTGKPELGPLAKGLADMLITDLSQVESLQIVEREKLNKVMKELELSKSGFIDRTSALALGKGLAAEFIMTGGYTQVGEVLRIDVRIFEVQTGKVVASEQVSGKTTEFFALEKDLVDLLVDALAVKLGRGEKRKLRSNATESFEAWTRYSAGLDARDRGNDEEARRLFQAALDADPSYVAAKNAMERLKVIFAREDAAKASSYDELKRALDPKAPDFATRVDAMLVSLDSTQADQHAKKVELLTWLAERNLTPSSPPMSRVPMEALAIAFRYADDPAEWERLPRVCEYFISRYPNEDYPKTYCRTAILKLLEINMKVGAAEVTRRWEADRAWERKYVTGEDDWRLALVKNDAGMRRLLALYAAKAAR